MGMISIGSVFLERYRIDAILGRGAYAKVYRAHQLDLGRDIALKVLEPANDRPDKVEEAKRRFEREAKLVARLQDPHTIHLFDWGTSPEGQMYMATELIDGQTLFDVWSQEDPMHWTRALRIVVQVLYSLQEAHEFGVLHRDIKPSNIMVFARPGRPDQVKVLDFGIAKAFESDNSVSEDSMRMALTARGRVVGTPGYMAPEQLRGEALSPATDMYAVGIIALELLTGEPAFKSRNDFETAALQLDAAPLTVPEDIEIPESARAMVNRMLLKRPSERLSDAAEAIEAFNALLNVGPPTVAAKPAEILLTELAPKPPSEEAPEKRRDISVPLILVIVFGVLAAGAAAFALMP